jgi:hypothetical protein
LQTERWPRIRELSYLRRIGALLWMAPSPYNSAGHDAVADWYPKPGRISIDEMHRNVSDSAMSDLLPERVPKATISIVVPAQNEAENLPILLRDLCTTLAPLGRLEIVVVDDGSTDNTLGVLFEAARLNNQIKYVRRPIEAGLKRIAILRPTANPLPDVITYPVAGCMAVGL